MKEVLGSKSARHGEERVKRERDRVDTAAAADGRMVVVVMEVAAEEERAEVTGRRRTEKREPDMMMQKEVRGGGRRKCEGEGEAWLKLEDQRETAGSSPITRKKLSPISPCSLSSPLLVLLLLPFFLLVLVCWCCFSLVSFSRNRIMSTYRLHVQVASRKLVIPVSDPDHRHTVSTLLPFLAQRFRLPRLYSLQTPAGFLFHPSDLLHTVFSSSSPEPLVALDQQQYLKQFESKGDRKPVLRVERHDWEDEDGGNKWADISVIQLGDSDLGEQKRLVVKVGKGRDTRGVEVIELDELLLSSRRHGAVSIVLKANGSVGGSGSGLNWYAGVMMIVGEKGRVEGMEVAVKSCSDAKAQIERVGLVVGEDGELSVGERRVMQSSSNQSGGGRGGKQYSLPPAIRTGTRYLNDKEQEMRKADKAAGKKVPESVIVKIEPPAAASASSSASTSAPSAPPPSFPESKSSEAGSDPDAALAARFAALSSAEDQEDEFGLQAAIKAAAAMDAADAAAAAGPSAPSAPPTDEEWEQIQKQSAPSLSTASSVDSLASSASSFASATAPADPASSSAAASAPTSDSNSESSPSPSSDSSSSPSSSSSSSLSSVLFTQKGPPSLSQTWLSSSTNSFLNLVTIDTELINHSSTPIIVTDMRVEYKSREGMWKRVEEGQYEVGNGGGRQRWKEGKEAFTSFTLPCLAPLSFSITSFFPIHAPQVDRLSRLHPSLPHPLPLRFTLFTSLSSSLSLLSSVSNEQDLPPLIDSEERRKRNRERLEEDGREVVELMSMECDDTEAEVRQSAQAYRVVVKEKGVNTVSTAAATAAAAVGGREKVVDEFWVLFSTLSSSSTYLRVSEWERLAYVAMKEQKSRMEIKDWCVEKGSGGQSQKAVALVDREMGKVYAVEVTITTNTSMTQQTFLLE